MDMIIAFLTAAGLGGIIGGAITSLLQAWLSRKAILDERRFREKKEAYIGILDAIKQNIESARTRDANLGKWRFHCDLVASADVRHVLSVAFNDGRLSAETEERLKVAMRKDLKIEME